MKKDAAASAAKDDTPAADTPPAATPKASDAVEAQIEPAFNPDHEWPSEGGSYVRQTDGSLKRED